MPDIPDDLMRELLKTFQVEAGEHLQTLNQTLLKVERVNNAAERRPLLQNAFRAAHSLKGAARSVGIQHVEQLAHSIENVLQQAHVSNTTPEPAVCDALYQILDGIQKIIDGEQIDVRALQHRLRDTSAAAVNSEDTATDTVPADDDDHYEQTAETISSVAQEETIRIAIAKIDELMAQSGELLISKINAEQRLTELQEIRQVMGRLPRFWRELHPLLNHVGGDAGQRLKELMSDHQDYLQHLTRALDQFEQTLTVDTLRLDMVTTDLQDDVRRIRMLPFRSIVLSLERAVHDAARTEQKQINFAVEGHDVELDKKVLEALKDPLLHLLRNSVAHGIESPEQRQALGKPEAGQIRLIVRQRGSEVNITVSDDGQGFNLDALRETVQTQHGQQADPDDIIALAFQSGVTTAQEVTAIAGRGVGLDVVRQCIEDIHGRLSVNNMPGAGVAIELTVPSSVTMMRGLVIAVGGDQFALPLLSIERIVEVDELFTVNGKQMLRLGDDSLPLVTLASILELPNPATDAETPLVVILSVAEQRLAVLVDDVHSDLELAVKPLGEPLRRVRNVLGSALLGTGQPIVILNPGDLIRSTRTATIPDQIFENVTQEDEEQEMGHVLVVDDSITTRTLEKNILEAAGYRVTIAIDGKAALKQLGDHDDIDLIVTDVQMPNMDGIQLTTYIRDSAEYNHLPVILVTSLESTEDRERGMQAGADAYIVKRGFNQATLLSTIEQFLERVG